MIVGDQGLIGASAAKPEEPFALIRVYSGRNLIVAGAFRQEIGGGHIMPLVNTAMIARVEGIGAQASGLCAAAIQERQTRQQGRRGRIRLAAHHFKGTVVLN